MFTRNFRQGWARWSRGALLLLSLTAGAKTGWAGYFAEDFDPARAIKGRDGKFYGKMMQGGFPGGWVYALSPRGTMERIYRFPYLRDVYYARVGS